MTREYAKNLADSYDRRSKARLGIDGRIRTLEGAVGGPANTTPAAAPAPSDSLGYVGSRLWDIHDKLCQLGASALAHEDELKDQINRIVGCPPAPPVGGEENPDAKTPDQATETGGPRGHIADLHAAVDTLHRVLDQMENTFHRVQDQVDRLARVTK